VIRPRASLVAVGAARGQASILLVAGLAAALVGALILGAVARGDGVALLITSGYRLDAKQAALFRRHADPKVMAQFAQTMRAGRDVTWARPLVRSRRPMPRNRPCRARGS
jgi:hypothetical protein